MDMYMGNFVPFELSSFLVSPDWPFEIVLYLLPKTADYGDAFSPCVKSACFCSSGFSTEVVFEISFCKIFYKRFKIVGV